MNKLVIFESPDNCFKTTNVETLAKEFFKRNLLVHQLHYTSLGLTNINQTIQISTQLYKHGFMLPFNTRSDSFIMDRFHFGEMVYGKIYRNYEADFIYDIERKVRDLNPKWWNKSVYSITLYDDVENLIERDDGKSFTTDPDKKQYEIERFILASEKSFIKNKMLIRVTGETKENLAKKITNFVFGE